MQILRRPGLLDDLTEAYSYLADRSRAAAERLLDEVEVLAQLLAAFPELGRRRDVLRAGVRSFRLRRFFGTSSSTMQRMTPISSSVF